MRARREGFETMGSEVMQAMRRGVRTVGAIVGTALLGACQVITGIDDFSVGDATGTGSTGPASCPNVDIDPDNCGACGHGCLGAPCEKGICRPVEIAQTTVHPSYVAVDSAAVYWAWPFETPSDSIGAIWFKLLAGEEESPLMTGIRPYSLASDGTNVYWADGTFEMNLYTKGIMRVPRDQPEMGKVFYAESADLAQHIVLDGEVIYWAVPNKSIIRRAPIAGGGVITDVVVEPMGFIGEIALDDLYVYWGNSDGFIRRRSKDLNGGIEGIVATDAQIVDIDVDATHVYWASAGKGTVHMALKEPGAKVEVVDYLNSYPRFIKQAGDYVYWVDFSKSDCVSATAKVRRRAKKLDPALPPEDVATDLVCATDFAEDTTSLYFGSATSIFRLTK